MQQQTQQSNNQQQKNQSYHFPPSLSTQACLATDQAQLTISPIPLPQVPTNTSSSPSSTRCSQNPQFYPFKCPLCLHTYRSQTSLNYHMRKEHSVLI